jgi:hypothetical protein
MSFSIARFGFCWKFATQHYMNDVETGNFEIEDTIVACDRLLERLPDAVIWRLRVGHLAVSRFGIGRLV